MLATDVINILRREINGARTKGLTEVSIDSLDNLVNVIDEEEKRTPEGTELRETSMERFRSELANWQAEIQRDHESNLEMQRATIATGQLAMKSALLINGGAAVAFLAFLGNAWSRFTSITAKETLAGSLEQFVLGVVATGLGITFAYVCQAGFGGELGRHSQRIGEWSRWGAVGLVMGSFLVFL